MQGQDAGHRIAPRCDPGRPQAAPHAGIGTRHRGKQANGRLDIKHLTQRFARGAGCGRGQGERRALWTCISTSSLVSRIRSLPALMKWSLEKGWLETDPRLSTRRGLGRGLMGGGTVAAIAAAGAGWRGACRAGDDNPRPRGYYDWTQRRGRISSAELSSSAEPPRPQTRKPTAAACVTALHPAIAPARAGTDRALPRQLSEHLNRGGNRRAARCGLIVATSFAQTNL